MYLIANGLFEKAEEINERILRTDNEIAQLCQEEQIKIQQSILDGLNDQICKLNNSELTPEEAFLRKHGADQNDRLELAGMEFHKRVYDGYCALAKNEPNRFIQIDGRQTPEKIFGDILAALQSRGCL